MTASGLPMQGHTVRQLLAHNFQTAASSDSTAYMKTLAARDGSSSSLMWHSGMRSKCQDNEAGRLHTVTA